MRTLRGQPNPPSSRGFSLIELMLVLVIISLVVAAILTQAQQVQQRAVAEQGKVDNFQQARDFLDQIYRDARQMGYPNLRNFDTTVGVWQSTLANDSRLAVGLVKLSTTQLEFQGDVDGSGTVSVVSYMVNGSGTCATCLQRAQVAKVNGDALTGQTNFSTSSYSIEVQNVQNTSTVFTAYDTSGNAITLPIDITNNAAMVPTVRTIQMQLSIANAAAIDPQTRLDLEADIEGRVQVVNCSMATTGLVTNGINLTCQ